MDDQVRVDNEMEINSAWKQITQRIAELDKLEKELLDFKAELQNRERELLERERKVAEQEKPCQMDAFFDLVNRNQRESEPKKRKGIRLSVDWG